MSREIRDITSSNEKEILSLNITKEQHHFIEPISQCLAEAKEDNRYVPLGLYKNDKAVGFSMYGKFEDQVWLDRFLIDKRFQGTGLGQYFMQKLIEFLKIKFPTNNIYLSVYENNKRAIKLYKKLGFIFINEEDENGEKVMKMK